MRRGVMFAALAAVVVLALPGSAAAAVDPPRVASAPSPYRPGCNGGVQTGTVYPNTEVEPQVAVNQTRRDNVIAIWQQDRWSTGGANGLPVRVSFDGARSWQSSISPPFSHCAGGSARNGGDYQRASDPWVSFSPDGTAYVMSLSINDTDNTSAMLVARSRDGGRSWGPITTLIRDASPLAFNDKNSLTADPTDSRFVYAVWDRLSGPAAANHGEGGGEGGNAAPRAVVESRGPTYFARTTDGGASWEPARPIFDPGPNNQTIGNQVAVLPDGTLLDLATVILGNNLNVAVLRSTDRGVTWSAPIYVAGLGTVGVTDPRDGAPVRTGDIIPDIAVDPRPGHDEVYVTWQDARFSGGRADAVVLSRSTDGGRTFSPPRQVSSPQSGQAFNGVVSVDGAGVVGVSYYDFTFDTTADQPLRTDTWITRSSDGQRFGPRERLSPASFDLRTAPVARGFFVGDYDGLEPAGAPFVALYSDTTGNAADPTDAVAQRASGNSAGVESAAPPATATTSAPTGRYQLPVARH